MTETWITTYLQDYYMRYKANHNARPPNLASVDSSNAIHTNENRDKEIVSHRLYGPQITYTPIAVNTE